MMHVPTTNLGPDPMLLPPGFDLLGTWFTVRTCKLNDDDMGVMDTATRTVSINEALAPSVQLETFYHELVHAIMDHVGIAALLDERAEEVFAQALGMALLYVLSRNKLPVEGIDE